MATPLTGQIAVSGTAQQLDAGHTADSCVAFALKAPAANSSTVYVGPAGVTSSTGHALDPGETLSYERMDQNGEPPYKLRPSDFYVVGSGGTLTWFASP